MSAWRIGSEAANPVRAAITTLAEAESGAEDEAGMPALQAKMGLLVKWIPGDTLAIYGAGVTLLASDNAKPSLLLLVLMILVTPLFVLVSAYSKGSPLTGEVYASAGIATVAFAAWSLTVPLSGWHRLSFVAENTVLVTIIAAIIAVLFSSVAEGLSKRKETKPA